MRARNCHVVAAAFPAVAAAATLAVAVLAVAMLAVAGCGARLAAGTAAPGAANGSGSAQPVRPRSGVTVTLSRRPRPGKLPTTSAAPSRHRRITAGRSGQVTVTAADDGATVVLNPGQVITVVLSGQGVALWDRPRLSEQVPGVLRQLSASGGYPAAAPARASYRAVRAGAAEIVSSTDARCLHAQPPCAIAQRLWRVTVQVR